MAPSAVTSLCPVDPGRVPQDDSQRPVRQWADQLATMYGGAITPLQQYLGNYFELVNLDPGIFPQFDAHGKELSTCFGTNPQDIWAWHLLDSSDWDYMITTAGTSKATIAEHVMVLPDCPKIRSTNSNYTSIAWSYGFNEWYEGAGIEQLAQDPTFGYPYDFGVQPLQVVQQRLP